MGALLAVIDKNNRVYSTHAESLSPSPKWRKNWFHLKGVSPLVNFLKPAALYTMERARSLALAQTKTKTRLYMLSPKGTQIFFADRDLPNKFQNEILGPEKGRFVAEAMDASGSTLFLLQRGNNAQGEETHKMYTRSISSSKEWKEQHPISLRGKAHLTSHIGLGHNGKRLQVEGMDAEGNTGYYTKKINAKRWKFKQTGNKIQRAAFRLPPHKRQKGPRVVHDYKGKVTLGGKTVHAILTNFSLKGFSERGLSAQLKIPSKKITYSLEAQKELNHILGLTTKHTKGALTTRKRNHSVTILKTGKEILIEGKEFSAHFSRKKKDAITHQLPPRPVRYLLISLLFFLHSIKFTLKACSRIFNKLFRSETVTKARERLFQSLHLPDPKDTQAILKRLASNDPSLAPKALIDFLSNPAISKYLRKMMKGANVLVRGKKANTLFRKLTQLPGVSQRRSSHPHKSGTSYGFESPLFGELLFWKDLKGKVRLQFEAHSLKSLFKIYCHTIDFFQYKLYNRQQGVYGSSKHTDAFPIVITI